VMSDFGPLRSFDKLLAGEGPSGKAEGSGPVARPRLLRGAARLVPLRCSLPPRLCAARARLPRAPVPLPSSLRPSSFARVHSNNGMPLPYRLRGRGGLRQGDSAASPSSAVRCGQCGARERDAPARSLYGPARSGPEPEASQPPHRAAQRRGTRRAAPRRSRSRSPGAGHPGLARADHRMQAARRRSATGRMLTVTATAFHASRVARSAMDR
jgi:hypothetical protein